MVVVLQWLVVVGSGGYNLRGDDGRLNISKSSSFLQNCESYFKFIPLFFSIILSVGVCGGVFLQLSPTLLSKDIDRNHKDIYLLLEAAVPGGK